MTLLVRTAQVMVKDDRVPHKFLLREDWFLKLPFLPIHQASFQPRLDMEVVSIP